MHYLRNSEGLVIAVWHNPIVSVGDSDRPRYSIHNKVDKYYETTQAFHSIKAKCLCSIVLAIFV